MRTFLVLVVVTVLAPFVVVALDTGPFIPTTPLPTGTGLSIDLPAYPTGGGGTGGGYPVGCASGCDQNEGLLTVTGEGSVDVAGDQVVVNCGVRVQILFDSYDYSSLAPLTNTPSEGMATPPNAGGSGSGGSNGGPLPPSDNGGSNVTLDRQADVMTAVQTQVASQADSLVKYLQSSDVSQYLTRLQTTGVTLNPVYRYDDFYSRQVTIGYVGTNQITFTVEPPDEAADIVSKLIQNGASTIDSVYVTVSPKTMAQAKQMAIGAATKNAVAHITAAMDALTLISGNRNVKLISLAILDSARPDRNPYPIYNVAAPTDSAGASGGTSTTPIVGGTQTVTQSVALTLQVTKS